VLVPAASLADCAQYQFTEEAVVGKSDKHQDTKNKYHSLITLTDFMKDTDLQTQYRKTARVKIGQANQICPGATL
jgi:hypothetical protein